MQTASRTPQPPKGGDNTQYAWAVIMAIILYLVLVSMCSCKSHKAVVTDVQATHDTLVIHSTDTIHQHDTIHTTNTLRDSIYLHDSVWYSVITKGDTVYVDKYQQKVQYRDRVKHDSIYLHATDTLLAHDTIYQSKADTTVVTVTKEVEKQLTRWQKFKQGMGVFFMGVLALLAVIFVVKNWARIKSLW